MAQQSVISSSPRTPGSPALSLSEVPRFLDEQLQALLRFWTAWGVVHTSLFSPAPSMKHERPLLVAVHLAIIVEPVVPHTEACAFYLALLLATQPCSCLAQHWPFECLGLAVLALLDTLLGPQH